MVFSFCVFAEQTALEQRGQAFFMKAKQKLLEGKLTEAIPLLEKALQYDPKNGYILGQLAELNAKVTEWDKAEQYAKQSIELDPNQEEIRFLYASILAQVRKFSEATVQYQAILKKEPNHTKARLLLGILYSEMGEHEKGLETLTRAIDTQNDPFMAYFYRAKIYLEIDQEEKAIKDLEKSQNLKPNFVEAGTALGLLYERLGKVDKAIEAYSKIQGNGRFRKRLAEIYLQQNEFNKALTEFMEYEEVEEDDFTVKVKVGLLLYELKKYDQAIEKFKTILKQQADAENIHFYLGAIYEDKKEFADAKKHFQKISTKSSFYREASIHLALIYKEQKLWSEGLAYSLRMMKQIPEAVEFYDLTASFYDAQEKYEKAEEVLQKGIVKFPKEERLVYYQGILFEKMGRKPEAVKNMKKILENNPNSAHALNFLGYSYAETSQNLDEAEGFIRKALELKPEDPYIKDSLAWVLFKKGKVEEAKVILEKLVTEIPNEAVVYEHLGEICLKQSQMKKAEEHFKKALQLTAKNEKASRLRVENRLKEIAKNPRNVSAEVKVD